MSNILFQKQLDISLHQRKTSYGTIKGISTAIGKNLKLTQDSETISVNRKSLKSNKKWFLFHFKNSFCSLYLYFFRGFLSSIVQEVIGTILFFYEEILHAKKILKKNISKYMLTNTQIKGCYLHFMLLMLFKRIISFLWRFTR